MMREPRWWQRAVIYEILVPSFQDTNGDGVGDLPGIIQRLDYLQWLGVDAIWLTPIFESPMYDIGYDVSCYRRLHEPFGLLDDFQTLLSESHQRQIRVLLDFAPNHTSVDHPWFIASRSSREHAKRDWYLWSDGRSGGKPPNNWINRFGRSAWTWDATTQQYYFGSFSSNQPDLNWRNRVVRNMIYDIIRYWLSLGVDGLRIDALAHFIKDAQLRDNPLNPHYTPQEDPSNRLSPDFNQNQPELLEVIEELRAVFEAHEDRLFLAEVYQSAEQIAAYQRAGAHLLLDTAVLQTPFEALATRNIVDLIESRMSVQGWPSHCSGNHDIGRVAKRVAKEDLRLAALLLLTLRGTPTIYYGEELGMSHYKIPSDQLRDPSGRDNIRYGRDGHRTPMPWTAEPHAGFTAADPWLPLPSDAATHSVAVQQQDYASMLHYYRRLLHFRRTSPALQTGAYRPLDTPPPLFAFTRTEASQGATESMLVILNINADSATLDLREHFEPTIWATQRFSTEQNGEPNEQVPPTQSVKLKGREGAIFQLGVLNK